MSFEDVVNSRQSVRGYKSDPVPREVIEEIIDVARRAPSSMNTQPWHVHVVTGDALDEVRTRNMLEQSLSATSIAIVNTKACIDFVKSLSLRSYSLLWGLLEKIRINARIG